MEITQGKRMVNSQLVWCSLDSDSLSRSACYCRWKRGAAAPRFDKTDVDCAAPCFDETNQTAVGKLASFNLFHPQRGSNSSQLVPSFYKSEEHRPIRILEGLFPEHIIQKVVTKDSVDEMESMLCCLPRSLLLTTETSISPAAGSVGMMALS